MWPNYAVLVACCLALSATFYLRSYVSLEEALRRGDVALVKRRLGFSFLGLDVDNGSIGSGSTDGLLLEPALLPAFRSGNTEVVALLLQEGADKDYYACQTATPPFTRLILEAPIGLKKTDMLEFMLEHGSNPDASDFEGNTPLHVAARSNREAAASILLKHGADPHIRNHEGLTPLDVAREEDSASVVAALVSLADRHGEPEEAGPTTSPPR